MIYYIYIFSHLVSFSISCGFLSGLMWVGLSLETADVTTNIRMLKQPKRY